ncbi:MAG: hypothetical protein KF852_19950 [Saprospiraceae bacterium]|nr:hypothetical protein [Saprospiraceae bacterium]
MFQLCFTALTGTGSTQVTFGNTPTAIEIINSQDETVPFNSVPGTVSFAGRWRWRQPDWFHVDDCECEQCDERAAGVLNVTAQNFTNIIGMQFSSTTIRRCCSISLWVISTCKGLPRATFGVPGGGGTNPGTITLSWTDPDLGGETLANGATVFPNCAYGADGKRLHT